MAADETAQCGSCNGAVPLRRGLFGRRTLPGSCPSCGAELTGEIDGLGRAVTIGGSRPRATPGEAQGGSAQADPQWVSELTAWAAPAGPGAPGVTVMLTDPGDKTIPVIKAIIDATQLGLADAKRLVDHPPSPLGTFAEADALQLVEAIGAAGGTCTTSASLERPGASGPALEVTLTNAGADLIAVVKEIRAATGVGLADAKRLVDDVPSPLGIFEVEEALLFAQAITDAGGTTSLAPARS